MKLSNGIEVITKPYFEKIYDLWIHTEGMGLNTTDEVLSITLLSRKNTGDRESGKSWLIWQ